MPGSRLPDRLKLVQLIAVGAQTGSVVRIAKSPATGYQHTGMTQRIYVDFNTMATDSRERGFINVQLQPDLAQILQPGMSVTLYDEEMEVEARVEFDPVNSVWQGQPNWTTCRDVS